MVDKTDIIQVLAAIDNEKDMSQFLSEILTPGENKDIALRWRLLHMIREGVPQRKIASELGVSLCKITRGSRILKDKKSICRRYLPE
ncbi:MAG: Trp family transcriptional regulator [Phycisphaerae bacterium]